MNINLEQDWLRFDSASSLTASYYGYNTNVGAADSSNTWSIRQVVGTNSMTVTWNNNIPLAYEASWTNRAYYFATPSNISITGTATTYGSAYNVTFTWTTSTGSSRYYVNFTRNNTTIYNTLDAGGDQFNPYQNSPTKVYINTNSATLVNCPPGYTYSASIYAANGVGVSSTTSSSVRL